jgi:mannose-6-phosphate isomerase-like protein (cupin superfamily)
MTHLNLEEFTKLSIEKGYDGVAVREWAANSVSELHTHEFSVHGMVTQGEMWLTRGDHTDHLKVGDTFTMEAETPHSERYGDAGTTYWAARKFPKI